MYILIQSCCFFLFFLFFFFLFRALADVLPFVFYSFFVFHSTLLFLLLSDNLFHIPFALCTLRLVPSPSLSLSLSSSPIQLYNMMASRKHQWKKGRSFYHTSIHIYTQQREKEKRMKERQKSWEKREYTHI